MPRGDQKSTSMAGTTLAEAFTETALAELDAAGESPTRSRLAQVLGFDEQKLERLLGEMSVKRARDLAFRWNAWASRHPPLPRMVVLDHGGECEIALGARG